MNDFREGDNILITIANQPIKRSTSSINFNDIEQV